MLKTCSFHYGFPFESHKGWVAWFYVTEVDLFHAAGNRRVNSREHRACYVGKSHPSLDLVLDRRELEIKQGFRLEASLFVTGRKPMGKEVSIFYPGKIHDIEYWNREWGIG